MSLDGIEMDLDKLDMYLGRINRFIVRIEYQVSFIAFTFGGENSPHIFIGRPNLTTKTKSLLKSIGKNLKYYKTIKGFLERYLELIKKRNHLTHAAILKYSEESIYTVGYQFKNEELLKDYKEIGLNHLADLSRDLSFLSDEIQGFTRSLGREALRFKRN